MALNFFSALLGALGACLLAWNLWLMLHRSGMPQLGNSFLPQAVCFSASLGFAFSKSYWSAALSAKGGIYVFQMVLILALLLSVQSLSSEGKGRPNPIPRKKILFPVFLFSIGLLNHWPTQMLLLPAGLLAGLLYLRFSTLNKDFKIQAKTLFQICSFSLFALSAYLYLPLRSNLYPHLNFGAPATFARSLGSILRITYFKVETMASAPVGEFQHLVEKTGYISNSLLSEFNGLFVVFTLIGIYSLIASGRKKLVIFLLVVLFATIWANVFYLRVAPIEFWHLNDHLLGANWVLALTGGYGLANTVILLGKKEINKTRRILQYIFMFFIALALPFSILLKQLASNDQTKEFLYRGYGMAILKSMDKGAYYFAESDYDLFALSYLTEVEGKRPDTHLLWTSMLNRDFQPNLIKHQYPDLNWNGSVGDLIPKLIQTHAPIYCAFSNGPLETLTLEFQSPFSFRPSGIAIQAFPHTQAGGSGYSGPLDEFWDQYLEPGKRSSNPINGLFLELCAHPYLNTAHYLRMRGDLSKWDRLYDRALSLIQENQWQADEWSIRADGDSMLGNKPKAIGSYLTAAGIYLRIGQQDKARNNFRKAALLDPSDADLARLSAGTTKP